MQDEMKELKARATALGVAFSPNIGYETLLERVEEAEFSSKSVKAAAPDEVQKAEPVVTPTLTLREQLKRDYTKLVRLRITCMNPNKSDLSGEYITVANEYIGTITKFIPFGKGSENGYHVPECLHLMLKSREYLAVSTTKDRRGNTIITSKYLPEFSIEVLPPLTEKELHELRVAQLQHGIDSE